MGLDVHSVAIVIAVADGGRSGEVRLYGKVSSDLHAVEKALHKIGGEGVTLRVVYEAGSTGFVVYRRLQQLGIDCVGSGSVANAPTQVRVAKDGSP